MLLSPSPVSPHSVHNLLSSGRSENGFKAPCFSRSWNEKKKPPRRHNMINNSQTLLYDKSLNIGGLDGNHWQHLSLGILHTPFFLRWFFFSAHLIVAFWLRNINFEWPLQIKIWKALYPHSSDWVIWSAISYITSVREWLLWIGSTILNVLFSVNWCL